MELKADRRRRHADPDPDRVREAFAVAADYRSTKVRMAKLLAAIELGGDHLVRGHSSVRDFAAQELGLPGVDVPMLLSLGRSLRPPEGSGAEPTPERVAWL